MRRLRERLRSLRLTLELLLGRRLLLFAILDLVVLGTGLLSMLLAPEGGADSPYFNIFLIPSLFLGLPALAGMVDVERRAGCLDLALSAPAAEIYFVRRAAAVGSVMAFQGALVVLVAWLVSGRDFPVLSPLLSVAAVSVFLPAVALFWAVRLRSAGAVWLASAVTVALFGSWVFTEPIPPRFDSVYGPFLPGLEAALPWLRSLAVLFLGSALFFLYARRRLRRPEQMIS